MRAARRWLVGVLLANAACSRSSDTIELKAAFSDDTVVGDITSTWRTDGEQRVGDSGATEQRVTFEVDVQSRLAEPLYLRVRDVQLIVPGASPAPENAVECRLNPGTPVRVLRKALWMPVTQAQAIRGLHIRPFAVPLSQRGRAFYREFLLRQRPADAVAIDAELATYGAAPPCADRHDVPPP